MTVKPRRAALTAFLKARRAAIAPESIGLARGARRLTPGLRREELAANAGVGLTWYTWLEQGRDITPSPATLYRIAKALRLSEADREYMFALVDPAPPDSIQIAFEPTCAVAGVLRAFQGPAAVLDPIFELVASNPIAEHLFGFEQGTSAFSRNQLWQLFNNPQRRALYEDVSASMQNFVALFRLTSAPRVGRPEYEELVAALLRESQEFAGMWNERLVAPRQPHAVRMIHPSFGTIAVDSLRLPLEGTDGSMIVFLAPANEATADAFARWEPPAPDAQLALAGVLQP